jgi:hypothetical protein
MKANMKWTVLAMAVAALTSSAAAFAQSDRNNNDYPRGDRNSHNVEVSLDKDISLSSDIEFWGDPEICRHRVDRQPPVGDQQLG